MSWIVPAIHPAALLRDQTFSLATLSDLQKAVRIAVEGPSLIPAAYKLGEPFPPWALYPSVDDVLEWLAAHRHETLALDLETTYHGDIMCCGLWPVESALTSQGICIPFHKRGLQSYWSTVSLLRVKEALFGYLTDPSSRIVGQNIVGFDIQRMHAAWGIKVRAIGDTMVAHSLCMPELPHGLAFLSSVFTDLSPYKKEFGESKEAKDDTDKWERVQDMEDEELRVYNLLDCFATAVTWAQLERMMS